MQEGGNIQKTRIRTKLLIGMLGMVLLMMVVAGVIIRQQLVIEHSFSILEHMNTIERLLLECRRQEKNFLLRHDRSSIELFASDFEALQNNTMTALPEVSDTGLRSKLDGLKGLISQYGRTFDEVKSAWASDVGMEEQHRLAGLTVSRARECHALVAEIRESAISSFKMAGYSTHAVSLSSVLLGLLLSFLLAGMLTRHIVNPLEYLREFAEKARVGDIQDMDVQSSDLEMKRFNSRETYDLARSLQCLVTNMRLLVSTERGLMDPYHMTIAVLLIRAVGSCGWAVIERARGAAGFRSFPEITTSNIDRFLTCLTAELTGLIPEDRVRLVIDAIRELKD